jgi:catechol 2,3-dioxygenase-like lactoylglutathione lyase family enzyme
MPMKISFVAGFGPIIRDPEGALAFWRAGLDIAFEEPSPGYFTTERLDGVKHFALWSLAEAAESTFGTDEWPPDVPAPQAWLEFDVESPDAVGDAVAEMEAAGHHVLRGSREEPWGQTTARLLSPEGLLVGITFTPWMHEDPPGPITES